MKDKQTLMPVNSKSIFVIVVVCLLATLSSCATISYYKQSISGQLTVYKAQQDFNVILQSADTPPELKKRLLAIAKIRDFASLVVKLPDNDSYRSYADIGRKYIVWNVFATPVLSLEPHQSCFLIVGCLSYRGYFDEKDALAYAKKLEKQGFDVYVGGVTAYSTLGWFDDPILNGMLERNDIELARLIFHELAHQQLYLKDDSEFNEAFADAVALIGLEYWLETNATQEQITEFKAELMRENQFTQLILSIQEQLNQIYQSNLSDTQKLSGKELVFLKLQQDYLTLRSDWGGYDEYDNWFDDTPNNAKVAAISTYRNLVPLFLFAHQVSGRDLGAFFSRLEKIGLCDHDRRRELLGSSQANADCRGQLHEP